MIVPLCCGSLPQPSLVSRVLPSKCLPELTEQSCVSCRNTSVLNLEVHMHLQMLYSPLRVLNAAEADVVYAASA